MADPPRPQDLPDGIFSLLDTDLYKLTMQCAILKYIPNIEVTYAFTNRTPDMRLSRRAYQWIQEQVSKLANVVVTKEEISYLENSCKYFTESYLRFLPDFKLRPSRQVSITFAPIQDTGSLDDLGDIHYDVHGLWLETILYEIPLLALTSEAYFKFCDKDWTHDGQEEKAFEKGKRLLENECIFSDFGTRRRRDYHTHDLIIQGLVRSSKKGTEQEWKGKLSGTSNVHFAMKYGIPAIGTVAHEWFMGIASVTNDYENANETALRYWVGCFGEGVLGIALTDTFGTPDFLKAFRKAMPSQYQAEKNLSSTQLPNAPRPAVSSESDVVDVPAAGGEGDDASQGIKTRTYAQSFAGVRQDSGDPLEFIETMRKFYDSESITDKKTVVFSDSLNIELCIKYKDAAEARGLLPTFGIGTFFTNDFLHKSSGKKSAPLNVVIKISSASGRPSIKISDNIGKNTGDLQTVDHVKKVLGYVEHQWKDGDEKTRWGGSR